MAFASATIVLAVVLLVFVVGGIFLEIFLARQQARWPGLVLPGLTFLYALAMALNVTVVAGKFPWGLCWERWCWATSPLSSCWPSTLPAGTNGKETARSTK